MTEPPKPIPAANSPVSPARPDGPPPPPSDGDPVVNGPAAPPRPAGRPHPSEAAPAAAPTPVRAARPDTAEEASEPSKPTPARPGRVSARTEVRVEERPLNVDGASWTAVLLGRSRTAAADIVLIGFRPPGATTVEREAWTVGESLGRVGAERLRALWEEARPPLAATERGKPLFPESAGDRRRGR